MIEKLRFKLAFWFMPESSTRTIAKEAHSHYQFEKHALRLISFLAPSRKDGDSTSAAGIFDWGRVFQTIEFKWVDDPILVSVFNATSSIYPKLTLHKPDDFVGAEITIPVNHE